MPWGKAGFRIRKIKFSVVSDLLFDDSVPLAERREAKIRVKLKNQTTNVVTVENVGFVYYRSVLSRFWAKPRELSLAIDCDSPPPFELHPGGQWRAIVGHIPESERYARAGLLYGRLQVSTPNDETVILRRIRAAIMYRSDLIESDSD